MGKDNKRKLTFRQLSPGTRFRIVPSPSSPKGRECPIHEKIKWEKDPEYPLDAGFNCIVQVPGGTSKKTFIYGPVPVVVL
jgi:hypothetical protein